MIVQPKVLVIGLGGTIAMGGREGGGLRLTLSAAEIVAMVGGAASMAAIETLDMKAEASSEIGLAEAAAVAQAVRAGVAAGAVGVVVMQGTDTLEDTAFALDLLLDVEAPVVLTGAMRGSDALGADGPANLAAALRVAVSPASRGLGVVAVLNDQIHAARYVHKGDTASLAAFSSPGAGPLGVVVEGRVRLMLRPASRSPTIEWRGEAPVAVIPVHGGASPDIVDAVARPGIAGVVVAALGAGHVPRSWSEPLGRLAEKMPVVLASQVGAGPVFTGGYGYPGGEIDLISRGLTTAGALTPNKARALLALLVGGGRDRAAIAEAFAVF